MSGDDKRVVSLAVLVGIYLAHRYYATEAAKRKRKRKRRPPRGTVTPGEPTRVLP